MDVSIIGGGPTGLFAAFYAGFRNLKTKIIEALPCLGGQITVLYPEKYIYDVPGFQKILAKTLVQQLIEQAMQFQPEVVLEQTVEQMHLQEPKKILLKTQREEHISKAVLIATGIGSFQPNRLNVPGVAEFEGKGVEYFVRQPEMFQGKRVLIVGGGDSAVDWAIHLTEIAQKITLIHRRDKFRAHEESVRQLLASDVDVKLFYELKKVQGNNAVEQAVIFHNKTQEEEVLPVDAVLLNLGFKADVEKIKKWGVTVEGKYIKVNERMETNLPGIFAAGDVVSSASGLHLNLLAVGFAQAAIAINCIAHYLYPEKSIFPGHSSEEKWKATKPGPGS